MLERLPDGQEAAARLAAAMIGLAAARRTGDLRAAAGAVSRAETLAGVVPHELARRRHIRAHVLAGRGAVELWSGQLDAAARVLDAGVAAAAAPGGEHERAGCLGHLALVEVLRGRLRRAAKLAGQAAAQAAGEQHPDAQHPDAQHPPAPQLDPAPPAALAALAWVHLEQGELREARGRLRQLDTALAAGPDKLIGAVAFLLAAYGALAEGRGDVAAQLTARARSGWPVPAWLGQRLSLAESRAHAMAGDSRAALAAAERAGRGAAPEAAVMLAHAWLAAGDGQRARRALAPALAAQRGVPEQVRVQAWLAEARLSYDSGDSVQGRRSLVSALRLAERERLRLPFTMERGWIGPVLRRDPELARIHQQLFAASGRVQPPAPPGAPAKAGVLAVEPLTEREREVLRHVSGMLNTAEVASEMYISINTVKAHLKSIYRKLAATHRGEAVRRARQLELI